MYVSSTSTLQLDQGAIVGTDVFEEWYPGSRGVVLTPRCDIDQGKAEFILLAAVVPPLVLMQRQGWKASMSDAGSKLLPILEWNSPRWHWLAPIGDVLPDGGIVDFQAVISLQVAEALALHVVQQVETPYREHLGQRYAAYMGRVGVMDLEDRASRTERRNRLIRALEQHP